MTARAELSAAAALSPDLSEARRLFDCGVKLCKLLPNQKRPEGGAWNLNPVTRFDETATGYGVLLAANGLCSVDPDNEPLAAQMLRALGLDLEEVMRAGVRSASTRPGSGGRSVFKAAGELEWIKFSFKGTGTVLELRAASPNLQDVIPGLVYADKTGQLRTQHYVSDRRLDDAPDLPPALLNWWRRMSTDLEFKRAQQELAGKALGLAAQHSISGKSTDGKVALAFASGRRQDFNAHACVEEILLRHGYEQHGERFAPPTATGAPGVRSVPGKDDLWQSDHASDALFGTFDAWTAFVVLDHDGNQAAAEAAADASQHARMAEEFESIAPADAAPAPGRSWDPPAPIASDEWATARLAPACIVENYLYADVALMIAPGGTGKTTLLLYEAIHIVLGLPLWGRQVKQPGPVLVLTAEDPREVLVARLREIAQHLNLTPEQQHQVMRDVLISDLAGSGWKLSRVHNDVVLPSELADLIVRGMKARPPVLVTIDPAVSFGVGEARVNDAEQGLIDAGRRIRAGLNCCVRFVHHTGKQVALERREDQYAGRGGSAFADGARMVVVMHGYRGRMQAEAKDWMKRTHTVLGLDETGIQLTLAKLSYAAPQPPIFVRRTGHAGFSLVEVEDVVETARDENERAQVLVLDRVRADLEAGTKHTKATLEAVANELELSRKAVRDALLILTSRGALEEVEIDPPPARGARKFLQVIGGDLV